MFQGGTINAHQLTEVTGRIPGLQMLIQREEEHQCLVEYGQHLSSGMHQQSHVLHYRAPWLAAFLHEVAISQLCLNCQQ